MEIDPSEETFEFDIVIEEGAIVPYGRTNIGFMGRCFAHKHLKYTTTIPFYDLLANYFIMTYFRDEIISFLDTIDNRVEALRKEALMLQEERDHVLTGIDLLKNTDLLSNLSSADHEEVKMQIKRINGRLQVRTSNLVKSNI